MAASVVANQDPVLPQDLVAGTRYEIRQRGNRVVASAEYTGRMRPSILGGDPIFIVDGVETPYSRARFSFYRPVGGGRRHKTQRRKTRRSTRKRSTR